MHIERPRSSSTDTRTKRTLEQCPRTKQALRIQVVQQQHSSCRGCSPGSSQSLPKGQLPASWENKKAATKRIHQCTYTVQLLCLYISWNVCSHLYAEQQLIKRWHLYYVQFFTWYVHVGMSQTHIFLYIHVHTRLNNVYNCLYLFMYVLYTC